MLHDIHTTQYRDILEKSSEIVFGITGGYLLWHLAIFAKTVDTQAIKCGDADIIIAGGQENMSAGLMNWA